MSNSAVLFVPAARCCARVGPSLRMCLRFRVRRRAHGGFGTSDRRDSSNSVPPMRGDGAPTGALILSVAPAQRDHPVPGRPGPLSALHRGDFRMRTHEAGSRQWNRSRSDCPRHAIRPGGRGPDLPRCGSRRSVGRHSWLRLSGSFLENAPLSQDTNPCTTNSIRSQHQSRNVAVIGKWTDQSTMPASRRALLVD